MRQPYVEQRRLISLATADNVGVPADCCTHRRFARVEFNAALWEVAKYRDRRDTALYRRVEFHAAVRHAVTHPTPQWLGWCIHVTRASATRSSSAIRSSALSGEVELGHRIYPIIEVSENLQFVVNVQGLIIREDGVPYIADIADIAEAAEQLLYPLFWEVE